MPSPKSQDGTRRRPFDPELQLEGRKFKASIRVLLFFLVSGIIGLLFTLKKNGAAATIQKSDEELLLENLEEQEGLENYALELAAIKKEQVTKRTGKTLKKSPQQRVAEAIIMKANSLQVSKSKARGVLVMSDSRDPREQQGEGRMASWWWASAFLAASYARRTGDNFIFYQVVDACIGPDGTTELSPPWCKVKAMLLAMDEYPHAEFFLYLDSDAAISSHHFSNSTLTDLASIWLQNDPKIGPVLLNQDAASFWCRNALPKQGNDDRHCLNAGVVFWRRHPLARHFLTTWWNTSVTQKDLFSLRSRFKWPWEQNGLQHAARLLPAATHIVPHSERYHLYWPARRGCIQPSCFAHIPEACCVIDHHCANRNDKFRLAQRAYDFALSQEQHKSQADDTNLLQDNVRPLPIEIDLRSDADKARSAALLTNTGMISS